MSKKTGYTRPSTTGRRVITHVADTTIVSAPNATTWKSILDGAGVGGGNGANGGLKYNGSAWQPKIPNPKNDNRIGIVRR